MMTNFIETWMAISAVTNEPIALALEKERPHGGRGEKVLATEALSFLTILQAALKDTEFDRYYAATAAKFPEYGKYNRLKPEYSLISTFLSWLVENGITLCRPHIANNDSALKSLKFHILDTGHPSRLLGEGFVEALESVMNGQPIYARVMEDFEAIVSKFLGVDYDKYIEDGRRFNEYLTEQIRKAKEGKPPNE